MRDILGTGGAVRPLSWLWTTPRRWPEPSAPLRRLDVSRWYAPRWSSGCRRSILAVVHQYLGLDPAPLPVSTVRPRLSGGFAASSSGHRFLDRGSPDSILRHRLLDGGRGGRSRRGLGLLDTEVDQVGVDQGERDGRDRGRQGDLRAAHLAQLAIALLGVPIPPPLNAGLPMTSTAERDREQVEVVPCGDAGAEAPGSSPTITMRARSSPASSGRCPLPIRCGARRPCPGAQRYDRRRDRGAMPDDQARSVACNTCRPGRR